MKTEVWVENNHKWWRHEHTKGVWISNIEQGISNDEGKKDYINNLRALW